MDTASPPVSLIARVARPALVLLALAIVASALLALLGASLDGVAPPDPAEPLLGPFRWTFRHAV